MCPLCLAAVGLSVAGGVGAGAYFKKTKENTTMLQPTIVSRSEWFAARTRLLAKEKELNRQRDALSEERRALPMVAVEKEYVFQGPKGRHTLADLFEGQRQLLVYHFMFEPDADEGCPACSLVADNFGGLQHLAARDTAFVVVSRAPIEKIERFRKQMGWTFPWVSSFGGDFNHDFGVTLDAKHAVYNFAPVSAQPPGYPHAGEREGLSVFLRDGDRLFHTYSTYQRGLDSLMNTYNFLDLTPLGRQEEEGIMRWVKHHDKY